MKPWVPQWPPQPEGRPPAPSRDPDQGLQRDRYYRPIRHSWHNGERVQQEQDMGRSPQPQQDPGADHQQPHYASRPGEWHPPVSRVDYYKGGYPSQLYSRYGFRAGIDPALLNAYKQIALFLVPFPFIFPLFLLFPSPPYYTDLAIPFPLPNWILVTENIIFSFLYPLGELLKEAITMWLGDGGRG